MTDFPHPSELAPHAAPMLLVDRVIAVDAVQIHAQSTISGSNIFFMPGRGLPSYIAFELMAQAVSVFDGWRLRAMGRPPQVGFLMGCRRYRVARDWFAEGEVLDIECLALINEGETCSFDCKVRIGGVEMASGVINVYRPDDPTKMLAGVGLG